MEIQYQNTRADFKAVYEQLWRHRKRDHRDRYYQAVFWHLAILSFGAYVAIKHEDLFPVCIFAVLALLYIKQNWSFTRSWNAQAEQYAHIIPENSCTMTLDDTGLTERFSGADLHVPWSEIHEYAMEGDRLFIPVLKWHSFVIPLRYLSPTQRDQVIKTLEDHNVRKKE